MKPFRQGARRWVYILPILHLGACFASMSGYLIPTLQYWGIAFTFILLFDFPISAVAYALGWKYPVIATIWIFVVGTLWWYVLSCGIELVFDKLMDSGPTPQRLIPTNSVAASVRRPE